MNVAFLSLGGNLGNRPENLNRAIKAIKAIGSEVLKVSSVYETEAWGSSSKKKYLNQVIKLKTSFGGDAFLKQLLAIEQQMGRKRTDNRNADRIIDIDLLFFNKERLTSEALQIPHPRLQFRNFVLVPLNEIEPGLKHPILKKTIRQLLKNSNDDLAVKLYRQQQVKYICIEGNIGSGKSTIARALAKRLKADYLPELFEDNYFLPLFYTDPKKYAFHLEYSFFISRIQQLSEYFKSPGRLLVCDFSLSKSLWFAKINLSKSEFAFYKKKVNVLLKQLPEPDLMVYLDSNLKNLKTNILKRGRSYEKNISTGYLQAVDSEYRRGFLKIAKNRKLLISIPKYEASTQEMAVTTIQNRLREIF